MASLSNDDGLRRIQICLPDGSRVAIRLGRIPLKQAQTILAHVERLQAAKLDGSAPDVQSSAWLTCVDERLRARLVMLGLAAPKISSKRLTVAELVEMFKDRPKWRGIAPSTVRNYVKFFRAIVAGLGATTPIDDVTDAAAENLRGFLLEGKPTGAGFALATASRCVGAASMLFRFAVRSRLLPLNPFEGVEQGSMATTRKAFVDAETSRTVLDALEGTQWRLLFALSRWGGLRVASEPRVMRWGDVDWERERFTVDSPKTGARTVPMFPELAQLFADRFAEAEDGDELVLPMMAARSDSTFSSHLAHVVRKLGLDSWPRMFHNMRSTRQTELEQLYPTYVVCAWLGNSPEVAHRHYLQVTDEHFAKAAQKAAQSASARPRMDETTAEAEA